MRRFYSNVADASFHTTRTYVDPQATPRNNDWKSLFAAEIRSQQRRRMGDFKGKVEETTARVNKTVSEAAERLEKDSAEFIEYFNREVVPAVRQQSTKALRIAAEKLHQMADYMEQAKKNEASKS
jgi:ribosomal protein L16/L10AE